MAEYKEIYDQEYLSAFGVSVFNNEYRVVNKEKLEKAYERAWVNRDFEINKFWTRAAYFWGFIVLTFGAYFTINNSKSDHQEYLSLLINAIGIILSVAWIFVIKGSKRWQENWEMHIDKLENFVSGPLYKTIFNKGKFYSVSKINEILGYLVLIIWLFILLFVSDLNLNSSIKIEANQIYISLKFILIIALVITFIYLIVFGYGRSQKNLKGFINRRSAN